MAKSNFRYILMSYNRYTDSFHKESEFRTLKSAKLWMWDEILDWLHIGYCVQKRTAISVEMKDDLGNIAAYRIDRIAA